MIEPINLETADIRPPRPDEIPALYDLLAGVFPGEGWLYAALKEGRAHLYTARPLVLVAGGRIAGSASRFDLTVCLAGRPVPAAGIAGVATPAPFRCQGVARRLMAAWMRELNADGAPGILFTGAPAVYEPHGFRAVEQHYVTVPAAGIPPPAGGLRCDEVRRLDADALRRAAGLYDASPNADGKVLRDARYWEFYQTLFNHSETLSLLFLRRRGGDAGYVRVERETDRLLVSELHCAGADLDAAQALLGAAARAASAYGRPTLTLALPETHLAWRALDAWGARPEPESGATREVFMVRGPFGAPPAPPLSRLRWSLADKF